jgi:hypothetical protein
MKADFLFFVVRYTSTCCISTFAGLDDNMNCPFIFLFEFFLVQIIREASTCSSDHPSLPHTTTFSFLFFLVVFPFHLLSSPPKKKHRTKKRRTEAVRPPPWTPDSARVVAGERKKCLRGRRGPAAAARGEAPARPCRWQCFCGGR